MNVMNPESPLFFEVYERPLSFRGKSGEYYDSPNHKAIVRMKDGEPIQIGMVGKNYKVIKMRELCESVEDELRNGLNPTVFQGVQVHDRTAYHGGICIRQYVFPSTKISVGNHSRVAFRTVIVNGYDGASSFKMYSGAIDFFCENGMVSGSYDMIVARHSAGLTIPKVASILNRSIEVFHTQANTWRKWVWKKITTDDARECFKSMPNVSDRRVEQLVHLYKIETERHGNTIWAMYSAATFFASHDKGDFAVRDTGRDHLASTLLQREKDVQLWQESESFLKLAA